LQLDLTVYQYPVTQREGERVVLAARRPCHRPDEVTLNLSASPPLSQGPHGDRKARADLEAAWLRARRAETAERRATQVLNRFPCGQLPGIRSIRDSSPTSY
jgi:hypothetical protein